MSGWSENPYNRLKTFEKTIMPSLVFEECQKLCVPANTDASKVSSGMNACLESCYEKHVAAFDLFMEVNYFRHKNKKITDYFDIDHYTEMETKLGVDMYNRVNHKEKLQETPEMKSFNNEVERECKNIRSQAM